jgi:hypothetical protein
MRDMLETRIAAHHSSSIVGEVTMPKSLKIIWEHTPDQKDIPFITSDTKKTFFELLSELKQAFVAEDIILEFSEVVTPDKGNHPNRVTLNGRLLDEILREVADEQRSCEGKRYEMNLPISFPAVIRNSSTYTAVPELLLRKVFIRAAGII